MSVTIDVRSMPPRERHPLIFQKLDALQSGEKAELINDHDPAPLRYQLMAERPDLFDWEYLEQGPVDWRVAITRK